MTLYYESSDKTIIDFMGGDIYAQEPETLTESEWNYTTISGVNGISKIKRFYKDAKAYNLTLDIMSDTREEFNELMANMHVVFDRDVQAMKPGRIWWNNFYKEVFVISMTNTEFDELFESVTRKLTILSLYPYWIKTNTYQFMKLSSEVGNLDYGMDGFYDGFDYGGYDYGQSENIERIPVNVIKSANFELIFYGPASQPSVTIGDHRYSLDIKLAAGEYATVNSISKKIKKYDQYGREENVFHARDRDSNIFEKLPAGLLPILRQKDLSFDVTVYDERGEPEWI